MRNTSLAVFEKIRDNGLLSKRRLEVYDVVFNNGPLTSAEAVQIMFRKKTTPDIIPQSRARFTELRDMGCLSELGTKKCTVTGNESILWDVTCDLPRYLPKVLSKKEKKKKLLDAIVKLGEKNDLNDKNKESLRDIYKLSNAL